MIFILIFSWFSENLDIAFSSTTPGISGGKLYIVRNVRQYIMPKVRQYITRNVKQFIVSSLLCAT